MQLGEVRSTIILPTPSTSLRALEPTDCRRSAGVVRGTKDDEDDNDGGGRRSAMIENGGKGGDRGGGGQQRRVGIGSERWVCGMLQSLDPEGPASSFETTRTRTKAGKT